MGATGDIRPKCLVELAGKALLDRQIAALRGGGASEVAVVSGYKGEMLSRPGLSSFRNDRWRETNMVISLAEAKAWLSGGPVIVSYADIFYRRGLVAALARAPGELVVCYDRNWRTLWSRRFSDPLADAETFEVDADGRLLEIGGKTDKVEAIKGQYMGLLKFNPPAWAAVAELLDEIGPQASDRLDMTGLLRRLLARGYPISTLATQGDWGEVDNPADLELYQRMAQAGEIKLDDEDR
jgi:choline kinase